jgi:hypothetical protein
VYVSLRMVGAFDHRVTSMPKLTLEGLEPCDGKLSRTFCILDNAFRIQQTISSASELTFGLGPHARGVSHIIREEAKDV